MGLFDLVLTPERRNYDATHDFWYTAIGAGGETNAGVSVSTDQAMRCSTVMACVRILSESIGSVPCKLYKRLEGGGKEPALNHDLYRLVHESPNPLMTPMDFFGTVMVHLSTCGNAYAPKTANNLGRALGLGLLSPNRMKEVKRLPSGDLSYTYENDDGKEVVYPQAQIVHIPGLSWDGLRGLSPIGYAKEAIGLTLAAEEFGARFFGSGTNYGAIMTMPEGTVFDDEQTEANVAAFKRAYKGLGKSHSVIALPNGTKLEKVGIPPEEAQFLETRRFQKADIASLFRVPLHMIQETEKATSWGSGIYSMTLNFITYALRPWAVRIEQALNRQLLTEDERARGYFFEFNLDALLRGDLNSQAEWFSQAVTNGILSRNEVRDIINRNPVEGGDEYLTPLNMGLAGIEPSAPDDDGGDSDDRDACGCGCDYEHRTTDVKPEQRDSARLDIQHGFVLVIRDAMDRIIRRERNDILQAAEKTVRKRGVTDLEEFVSDFYTRHEEFTRDQITPAFTALAEAVGAAAMREMDAEWEWTPELEEWLAAYIAAFANRQSNRSRQQLLDLIAATVAEGEDVVEALTQRFDEWQEGREEGAATRAEKVAAENSTRLGQGFAREAMFAAGAASMIVVNTGSETCPYCTALDGRSFGYTDPILRGGEDFAPGGVDPLTPSFDVFHPPFHGGCDCILIPGV